MSKKDALVIPKVNFSEICIYKKAGPKSRTGFATPSEIFPKAKSRTGFATPSEIFPKAKSRTGFATPSEIFPKAKSRTGFATPSEIFPKAKSRTGFATPSEIFFPSLGGQIYTSSIKHYILGGLILSVSFALKLRRSFAFLWPR